MTDNTDESPVHGFLDRAMRQSLQHADNLRALLRQVVPDLAEGFLCERARPLEREFLLGDWRRRESDVLIEIPYRSSTDEQTALVCILFEHLSGPDPRVPLRLLVYAVCYWERQWKAWEETKAPRPPLRLTPILPIVLHTGQPTSNRHRQLSDLLSAPEAFHAFAPVWRPLFWDLAEQSSAVLLVLPKNGCKRWP